jgi:hypothetical protein
MPLPTRRAIAQRLETTLQALVSGDRPAVLDAPAEIRPHLDALLVSRRRGVRDGLLVLLAMAVEHGEIIDWQVQRLHNPAREASADLGALYRTLAIPGSRRPALTAVAGLTRYIDRRNEVWKAVLTWASRPAFDARDLLGRIAERYGTTPEELCDFGVDSAALQQARFAARLSPLNLPQPPGAALIATANAEINYVVRDLVRESESSYGIKHVEEAFLYLATGVARTARSLPEMPGLDTPKLTFPAVFALLDDLLGQPSRGAYEQFTFAALLAAWYAQTRVRNVVVETKHINASDAAASTAGDVQVKMSGQVGEAYELTADSWQSKTQQAEDLLRAHRLRRFHILAKHATNAQGDELRRVFAPTVDISVLDLREEIRSLVARLEPSWRGDALHGLYRHLVEDQLDDHLVRAYVSALHERGLVA